MTFNVTEIDCFKALSIQQQGGVLLDVRESYEVLTGTPANALALPLSEFGAQIPSILEKQKKLICICQKGIRSLEAADQLLRLGYESVVSVKGGVEAWQAAGLAIEKPGNISRLNETQLDRYARHLSLPEVGLKGQAKLTDSKVLLIGAGGLGSPAALYLAAAGIGELVIVDDDVIERSNLQRQILHRDQNCGEKKIDSARYQLQTLNPDIVIKTVDARLDQANATELVKGVDVVIDGSDNFPTRYTLNQVCVQMQTPLVYAAVERFQAQVAVFWPAADTKLWSEHLTNHARPPCYQCVFPIESDRPGCVEAGVLGSIPGVAGTLQATEAIKLCLGIGQPLIGQLLRMDLLNMQIHISQLQCEPLCSICGSA